MTEAALSEPGATLLDHYYKETEEKIAEGLDFILSHFQQTIFPRTISTKTTEGRQVPIHNKRETLAWFEAANYLDCRISGYLCDYGGKISSRQMIDLVMIDLDLSTFKSLLTLDRVLNKTIRKIKETFGNEFEPSIIWSGNGYHIYIPIESRYILEERPEFSMYEEPSKQYLRFAEWYLSNGKADSKHTNTVSFGNCMLRIPGSHNSKCVQRNNAIADTSTQIKVLREWNGYKPPAYLLFGSFLAYLVDKKYKAKFTTIRFSKGDRNNKSSSHNNNSFTNKIPWIETLLQTQLADYRKYVIFRILPRYLINKKGLCYNEAFNIIKDWLKKCNSVRRLDSNFNSRIKENLDYAIRTGKFPISLDTLKSENKRLYDMICNSTRK
jgi:hypothetical protein